jgi:hypothetical protein
LAGGGAVVRVIGRLSRDNDGLKWEKEEREMSMKSEDVATSNGKVVGIELKRDFSTVWLTIEVPADAKLPEYYSNVLVTDLPQRITQAILNAKGVV